MSVCCCILVTARKRKGDGERSGGEDNKLVLGQMCGQTRKQIQLKRVFLPQ